MRSIAIPTTGETVVIPSPGKGKYIKLHRLAPSVQSGFILNYTIIMKKYFIVLMKNEGANGTHETIFNSQGLMEYGDESSTNVKLHDSKEEAEAYLEGRKDQHPGLASLIIKHKLIEREVTEATV